MGERINADQDPDRIGVEGEPKMKTKTKKVSKYPICDVCRFEILLGDMYHEGGKTMCLGCLYDGLCERCSVYAPQDLHAVPMEGREAYVCSACAKAVKESA